MCLNDATGHRETNSRATGTGANLLVAPHMHVKDPSNELRRNSGAVVLDSYDNFAASAFNAQLDSPARLRVVGGIFEQVDEHLSEPIGIAIDGSHT
jgi:hypothetical protein